MKKTLIFGHRNPDTDSVTSAIALSYLKNSIGMNTEARILGSINKETEYALKYFGIKVPEILEDVKVQIKDIPFKKRLMIEETASIYQAYTYMVDEGYTGLPIVDENKRFLGYVSLKEIATDFIKGDFDKLNASYDNILKVLCGKIVLHFDDNIVGNIHSVTNDAKSFMSDANIDSDSIVIVGKREDILNYCIKQKVKLIILIAGQVLSKKELTIARKNRVNVIKTNKTSFEVVKLIGLSNYIKCILRNEKPVTFTRNDYLSDFYEISNKLKHTNYPIVDIKGKCHGMLRLIDVSKYERKEVILVDHNDPKQSVTGLNEASILEIVDHHALGNLSTTSPISFRNMIVGSTNTILYQLFKEAGVKIPKSIAGIMLSGILSDTLILKSPTTTEIDRIVVKSLARIAGVNYQTYGLELLKAGSSLDGLSIEEVVFRDYKEFQANSRYFGIGQVTTLNIEQIMNSKSEYIEYLDKICASKGFNLVALFITDIISNGSYVLYSTNAKQVLSLAFNKPNLEEGYYLKDIISRKKQIVPCIMEEFENMD